MKDRKIELGGAEYTISPITLNDLISIEDEGIEQDSMKGVRFLLYLSLVKKHPNMTQEKIGDLVTMENINDISDVLVGSLTQIEGEKPKGKAKRRRQ